MFILVPQPIACVLIRIYESCSTLSIPVVVHKIRRQASWGRGCRSFDIVIFQVPFVNKRAHRRFNSYRRVRRILCCATYDWDGNKWCRINIYKFSFFKRNARQLHSQKRRFPQDIFSLTSLSHPLNHVVMNVSKSNDDLCHQTRVHDVAQFWHRC